MWSKQQSISILSCNGNATRWGEKVETYWLCRCVCGDWEAKIGWVKEKKGGIWEKRERHGRVRNIYMSSLPQVGNWARGREVQQCPQHFQQQLRCNIDRSMATRHTEDKKQPLFQKHIHSHLTVRHAGGMRRKHRRYDWDLRDFFLINVTASQNNTLCTSLCTQSMFACLFLFTFPNFI